MPNHAVDEMPDHSAAAGETFAELVRQALGITPGRRHRREEIEAERAARRDYLDLLLASHGLASPGMFDRVAIPGCSSDHDRLRGDAATLLRRLHAASHMTEFPPAPLNRRVEAFLAEQFGDLIEGRPLRLPGRTLVLDRPGLARELSLPFDADEYRNDLVESYRVLNGVLHNPKSDRRTTSGTFHVVEGPLPVPDDKCEVPRGAFVELFRAACAPTPELATLPYTTTLPTPATAMVSLLLRPLLAPGISGVSQVRRMEIRFFVPGSLVSNLDFVESIFGNAGDPRDLRNDAALDVEHWSGHTGCVILAPHLITLRKKDIGLPHVDQATSRQKRDGMCWSDPEELYNSGRAFKLTCRTDSGVTVTLIADNYFGYCKKEVKTQLSYAANLLGDVEEEHAGGAIAFQSYSLGDEFAFDSRRYNDRTWEDVVRDYGDELQVDTERGYATHRRYPQLKFVKGDAVVSVKGQSVTWNHGGQSQSLPLLPGHVYMGPSGYRVRLEKHPAAPSWRLIGTLGTGTFCHKPCTVSGGGKSEISKSIRDFMLYGPIFVADLDSDLAQVDAIFRRDYSDRWRQGLEDRPDYSLTASRAVLDPRRTLGSVIKMLTPSAEYSDEYNTWLESIPNHIYALVFIIKRFQRPDWDADWRKHFYVDVVNGHPGHELKYEGRALVGQYLRVGLLGNQAWRTFKLRQDFAPAEKLQTEDDISVSLIVPGTRLKHLGFDPNRSYKFTRNCEYRLFQRPDEAIHRGMDKQTEWDIAQPDNFLSNFQPLTRAEIDSMMERAVDLDRFTPPMQQLLRSLGRSNAKYVVCSSNPRVIGGSVSKNPRYLQDRPDLVRPQDFLVAELGWRLHHAVPANHDIAIPVHAILSGRRNNAPEPEAGIRGLCVYNPIHYQPLPEMLVEFVASLSGKSPSTTGFGSEGALTKGPFNSLPPTLDLNAALISYALTELHGFSTPAGYVGPKFQVDHDISLLIPEIWCRMKPKERDPKFLIEEGLLERLEDFQFEGRMILAGRLGYRITAEFVRRFMGRVFDNPAKVFDTPWLRPETQDPKAFAEGIEYITASQRRIARGYFEDGSAELAVPPLRRLLELMAADAPSAAFDDPEFRASFTRESILASSWYRKRLERRAELEIQTWRRKVDAIKSTLERDLDDPEFDAELRRRLVVAHQQLAEARSPEAVERLMGTLGVTPLR